MAKPSDSFHIIAEPPSQNPHSRGLGNLLSQMVIGTTGQRPDFNIEEKASIEKDMRELRQIIREMADHLPREDPEKGMCTTTYVLLGVSNSSSWVFIKCVSMYSKKVLYMYTHV